MSVADIAATVLLQALPDPALVIRPDGGVEFANDTAVRFLGIDPATPLPNVTEFLPARERQRLDPLRWLLHWAEAPEAPEREFVHLTCRIADGGETAVRASVGRLSGPETRYVVILHDVGAELARQRKARDAHRIAGRVLAVSADAVVNVDADQRIEYVNASAERLFGYGPGELTGRPLSDLIPRRFHTLHAEEMKRFLHGTTPSRFMGERGRIVGLHRDGSELPLEATVSKVTVGEGVTYSALLRDLRPRLAAEHALNQSRARFTLVFDHAQQAMALLEPDGTVLEVNAAARRLLKDDSGVIGESLARLPWLTAGPAAEQLDTALARCRGGEVFRARAEVRREHEPPVPLDVSLSPVAEDGEVFAIVAEARELR